MNRLLYIIIFANLWCSVCRINKYYEIGAICLIKINEPSFPIPFTDFKKQLSIGLAASRLPDLTLIENPDSLPGDRLAVLFLSSLSAYFMLFSFSDILYIRFL
jgi:hypothetical protein